MMPEVKQEKAFGLVFCGYENFIVNSADMKKNTLNFDKVSFLSEQPDYHVDFLAAFLETQSFASFIDDKVNSRQEPVTQTLTMNHKKHFF